MTSPFLELPQSARVASNALAFGVRDGFPVSPGHTLVIPRRLVATWFDATAEERAAIFDLVDEVKAQLDAGTPKPDGYNIGINAGPAAGQTVMHLHVHVIPRYAGDVDDPRGGVRHVIPGKGNYCVEAASPLSRGGPDDPFSAHLRPLWHRAQRIDVVAAFVQESGLRTLREPLFEALGREEVLVRLVTGDYLDITQSAALELLLDWMRLHEDRLLVRVVETAKLPGSRSFHPKAWRFEGRGLAVAFVGSSNVSRSALGDGVEWNLRLERGRNPEGWRALGDAFDHWWNVARPLDAEWVSAYAARAQQQDRPRPTWESPAEPPEDAPAPHALQVEALASLARSREDGRTRALVVLATGLGKTLLAALDVASLTPEGGPPPRTLVLAHREELLEQAAGTFRRVFRRRFPGLRVGWCLGDRAELTGDLVLATVQKLARPGTLEKLRPGSFAYAVVDEFHHADAASYRRVLDRLQPGFLLGLTATPERADGGDILALVDDHVAYRADLGAGIARGLLVPFRYFGLKDDVDYRNIPWRNARFAPEELARAVETEHRMQRLWEGWQAHPGARSL